MFEILEAGEGVADITPPRGIELAGFHKPPGKERVVTGVRQPCLARALVLRAKKTEIALVSLDVCGFPRDFAQRVQRRAAQRTGIPAPQIRIAATHSHSTPTLRFFRQWGAVSPAYVDLVERRAVEVIEMAKNDLARADCYLGKERVAGGNFNRTAKTWKTDEVFGKDSTDGERWLDTMLHVLFLMREAPKRNLLWYHFSAHPVCFTDGEAGPDWPGLVADKAKARDDLQPAFLQGHCGDVNPGPGDPWLGDPEKVSEAVSAALHHAANHSIYVEPTEFRMVNGEVKLPLDLDLLREQVDLYRKDPAQCKQGEWVDAGFAKDWFESASKWDSRKTTYAAPLSALRIGEVALLFHPAELYSFYGLAIRRDSPFADTLVVGYADDFVGYLPDPAAFKAREYAAIVVPKILDWPAFKPEAAAELTRAATKLLGELG